MFVVPPVPPIVCPCIVPPDCIVYFPCSIWVCAAEVSVTFNVPVSSSCTVLRENSGSIILTRFGFFFIVSSFRNAVNPVILTELTFGRFVVIPIGFDLLFYLLSKPLISLVFLLYFIL